LPGSTVAAAVRVRADGAFMDRAGPRLRAIARPGIGVDNIDVDAAIARGILVANTPDAPTESTAEHAVALLMALAKRVVVDVFDPEPAHPDNPLLHMRNVVVTPHSASNTDRGIRAMRESTLENLVRALRGQRPLWLVNPQAWPGRFQGGAQ
jgi:lactate dehydrogenase-like 2-hydroxyacid dehydrogenase